MIVINPMNRKVYTLPKEPKGEVYRQLIETSLTFCETFCLITGNVYVGDQSIENSNLARERLKPWLIEGRLTSGWPGTNEWPCTKSGEVLMEMYRLNAESVRKLKQLANGLFEWEAPNLPEDPCFFRKDGGVWLTTISHERIAYLEITDEEKKVIDSIIPREFGEREKILQWLPQRIQAFANSPEYQLLEWDKDNPGVVFGLLAAFLGPLQERQIQGLNDPDQESTLNAAYTFLDLMASSPHPEVRELLTDEVFEFFIFNSPGLDVISAFEQRLGPRAKQLYDQWENASL